MPIASIETTVPVFPEGVQENVKGPPCEVMVAEPMPSQVEVDVNVTLAPTTISFMTVSA